MKRFLKMLLKTEVHHVGDLLGRLYTIYTTLIAHGGRRMPRRKVASLLRSHTALRTRGDFLRLTQ